MIYKIVSNILKNINKEINIRIRRLSRKYSSLIIDNIIVLVLLVSFAFLISGGVATIVSGDTQRIILLGYTNTQTVIEWVLYFSINIIYTISLYLMYIGAKKQIIDLSLIILGIIMLSLTLIAEIYIIAIVKSVPL